MALNMGRNVGGNEIPRTGLKMWLDAGNYESNSNSSYWEDICGNGILASWGNQASYKGTPYGHVDFDGTDDYAEITDGNFGDNLAGDITTALSIVGWAETDTALSGGVEYALLRKTNQFQLGFNGNSTVRNLIRTTGGTTGWTAANDDTHNGLTTNVWNMWSFTWDGSTLTNYQNLDSIGTHTVTGTLATAFYTNHVFIGAGSTSANEWNGGLDVMLVYNVSLTLAQLTQIYNVYRGRFDV